MRRRSTLIAREAHAVMGTNSHAVGGSIGTGVEIAASAAMPAARPSLHNRRNYDRGGFSPACSRFDQFFRPRYIEVREA